MKIAAERELKKGDFLIAKTFEYEKFSSEFEFTENLRPNKINSTN